MQGAARSRSSIHWRFNKKAKAFKGRVLIVVDKIAAAAAAGPRQGKKTNPDLRDKINPMLWMHTVREPRTYPKLRSASLDTTVAIGVIQAVCEHELIICMWCGCSCWQQTHWQQRSDTILHRSCHIFGVARFTGCPSLGQVHEQDLCQEQVITHGAFEDHSRILAVPQPQDAGTA